jgi:uronate dehydrogenase
MSREHVLVTGAAGLIGGILSEALSDEYAVHGLDAVAGPGVEWVADMTSLDEIQSAFDGMSAVLDLAANSSLSASWETVRENNIPATLNAFEAARRAGVRRVVFASSNHVVGMYEREEPYASVVKGEFDGLDPEELPRLVVDVPIRPDSAYGVGKAFGEAVGRYYAEKHEMSVSCLRIGTVDRANRPETRRHFATLLTHRDLVRLVRCCLSAPPSPGGFTIHYGVSANTWRIWDIDEARTSVGYTPEDDAEQFRASA